MITHNSPNTVARAAGFFWLMTIITGMFGFVAGGRFIVAGDAAATATNILSHESMYRVAFSANIIATACYLAVTVFIYVLLKPVDRNIALLQAFFSLAGCAIGLASSLLLLAPLEILKGASYAAVFTPQQLEAQALSFVNLSLAGNDVGLVFFGLHVLLIGYLIRHTTFLPRFLGVLLTITCICYLTSSFAHFFALPFRASLLPFVAIGGIFGEGALTFWLLVKGVNVQRWKEHARVNVIAERADSFV